MLVHPGGPFWAGKDDGAWSMAKGLYEHGDENPIEAAKREFREETGFEAEGRFIDLGELKQPSRKVVHAWAVDQDLDAGRIVSNTFTLEWPRNSGNLKEYPEVDRAEWFHVKEAKRKILKGQRDFIGRLVEALGRTSK